MIKPAYEERIKKVRQQMIEKGLDALLIEKQENYFYLTGMTGEESYCLVTHRDVFLVVDFRFTTQAKTQASTCKVVEYQAKVYETIRQLLEINEKVVGFDGEVLTWSGMNVINESFMGITLTNAHGIIEKVRFCKDEFEIQIIKEAVAISDKAFDEIIGFIRPGVSEAEISAELEYRMRRLGAKRSSFDTIVASGQRSALPHGTASEKLIENGDVVTLDYGAYYKGYCSDMTRTIFVGTPNPEIMRIYQIVLEAQMSASDACHSGKTGKQVDQVARDIIAAAGFAEYFGHGLGHGVGVEIHESPRLSPRFEEILENGMVVTVEPGIYVPGLGGVRIEDVIVLNDNNPIVLTKSRKDMIIL